MGLSINKDQNYGPLGSPVERHGVDCYWYNTDPHTPRACVTFVHGGGWQTGDKNDHRNDCLRIAQKFQINAFTINYKLGPDSYPDNIEDIQLFIDWLKAAPCCDDNKVLMIGISAGGHLVSLNAAINGDPKAVMNVCGPLDFTDQPQSLIDSAELSLGPYSLANFTPANFFEIGMSSLWDVRGTADTFVTDEESFLDNSGSLDDKSRQVITQDQHAIWTTSQENYDGIVDEFVRKFK